MNVKQLIEELQQYPANTPVRIVRDNNDPTAPIFDLTEEHMLRTSTEAYIDDKMPEEEWDHEDGKIVDKGELFLLFNPILL